MYQEAVKRNKFDDFIEVLASPVFSNEANFQEGQQMQNEEHTTTMDGAAARASNLPIVKELNALFVESLKLSKL